MDKEQNQEQSEVVKPVLFDKYELVKNLGEGGVGAVYLVRSLIDQQLVAMKVLTSEIPFDEHTLDRFRNEIALSRTLDHPNLIKAYELIEKDNKIAYTMEYVDGEDLHSIYKRQKLVPEAIDSIMRQLLSALIELHRHEVYHRDIKLENIMIGRDGVLKLADYGLVKGNLNQGFTKTGVLLGTAAYMPPEYIKFGKYDERSDIYAVGVVLYELLTNRRRLESRNGNEMISHLVKTNFALPKNNLVGLPSHYVNILLKATDVEPRRRYQSAEEMRDAFKRDRVQPLVEDRRSFSEGGSSSTSKTFGVFEAVQQEDILTEVDGRASRTQNKSPYNLVPIMLIIGVLLMLLLAVLAL